MGGFINAFLFWLPVLIYRALAAFFRTIWKFDLWILQTISGIPLYYCKPGYRIPAIAIGTLGAISVGNLLLFIITLNIAPEMNISGRGSPIGCSFLIGFAGIVLLLLCRILIRRGSL